MAGFGAERKLGSRLASGFARGCRKTRHTRLTTGMRFSVLTAEASVDRLARAA